MHLLCCSLLFTLLLLLRLVPANSATALRLLPATLCFTSTGRCLAWARQVIPSKYRWRTRCSPAVAAAMALRVTDLFGLLPLHLVLLLCSCCCCCPPSCSRVLGLSLIWPSNPGLMCCSCCWLAPCTAAGCLFQQAIGRAISVTAGAAPCYD